MGGHCHPEAASNLGLMVSQASPNWVAISTITQSYKTVNMKKKDWVGLFLYRMLETERSIRVFRSFLKKYHWVHYIEQMELLCALKGP